MNPKDNSMSNLVTNASSIFKNPFLEEIFVHFLPLVELAKTSALRSLQVDDSVSTWTQCTASRWRKALADPSNNEMLGLMRKHHFATTYTGGELIALQAKTVNGSDRAGTNGANVGQLEISVLLKWSSIVRKNGETEIQIFAYPASRASSRATLIRTNAMFTNADFEKLASDLILTLLNL